MITVKEAQTMLNTDYQEPTFSYDNFKKRLKLIRSLENYSNKLDILIVKTSNIEDISLKVGR